MGIIDRKKSILLNEPHLATASGNVTTFDTDLRSKLKECKINFLPVQSGSGDPSPTNIRPITGLKGLTGYVTGKNIFKVNVTESLPSDTSSSNATKRIFTLNTLIIGTSGTNYFSPNSASYSINGDILTINTKSGYGIGYAFRLIKGETYTISYKLGSDDYVTVGVSSYAKDGTFTRVTDAAGSGEHFIVPNDSDIILLTIKAGSRSYEKNINVYDIQLERSNSSTTYEPYAGTVIPISWQSEAGTLYGGYVDLVSGELVATHKVVDMGDLDWIRHNSIHYFRCSWTQDSFENTIEGFALDTFCSCYNGVNQGRFISGSGENLNYVFNTTYISSSKANIAVRDDNYSDATDFKTSVAGQKLVYPIANPITYQLTPQQLKSIKGANNIWSDAGDVEVKYWTH